MKSPRVSGTRNGGIDLISSLFRGWGFPYKPYNTTCIGEDSSFLQVPEHFLMNLLRDAASPITFLLCSRQRRSFCQEDRYQRREVMSRIPPPSKKDTDAAPVLCNKWVLLLQG